MADQTDDLTPMRTEEESSASESASDNSEEEEEEVEWMVTARQKRSTAGNRLASLLQREEPDDELELLFAEADDDAGFEDVDADQSDVQMDSSDDDEDQGPAASTDDLEGEKELQRQAKAEKVKKRKLNDGISKLLKKRVKIDPTASQAPAPRPKKKSERASWIPTPEDAPTRASQRGTTRQSKEQLHAQMVDREKKRLKQLANMEKAAAAKEAAKKPAMTQADRLAEATRVEKANSKSLSRWEEAEQLKEEEQRAKLAAFSNRHLDVPVITWWSGLAEWVGGRLKQVGKALVIESQKEKPGPKKRKAAEMEADSEATPTVPDQPAADAPPPVQESSQEKQEAPDNALPSQPPLQKETGSPELKQEPAAQPPPIQPNTPLPNTETPPVPSQPPTPQPTSLPSKSTPPPPPPPPPPHPSFILAPSPQWQPPPPALDGSAPLPGLGYNASPQSHPMPSQTALFTPADPPPQPLSEVPQPPATETTETTETTSRNLLILSNFDEMQIKNKDVQTQILFHRKFPKATKPKPPYLCAITSYPAKYRDPITGLPYSNGYAYKEIQRLKRGEYKWSALVGAYVGQGTYAARGVPPRFVDPLAKPPEVKETEQAQVS